MSVLRPYPELLSTFCRTCGWKIPDSRVRCRCGSADVYSVDINQVQTDMLDYPTAWAIQRNAEGLSHDTRCSAVQTIGGLLCDCGAIDDEWRRLRDQSGGTTCV